MTFRLPSEAEWEFACRAGSTAPYSLGETLTTAQANFNGSMTKPVGSYAANAFGLHDMHGNVWEWCDDWFADNYYSVSPKLDPRGPHKHFLGENPNEGTTLFGFRRFGPRLLFLDDYSGEEISTGVGWVNLRTGAERDTTIGRSVDEAVVGADGGVALRSARRVYYSPTVRSFARLATFVSDGSRAIRSSQAVPELRIKSRPFTTAERTGRGHGLV